MISVIVDFQGFKNTLNEFIIKEVAYQQIDHELIKGDLKHYLLKPPYSYDTLSLEVRKQVDWLENNHHGLRWEEGNYHYNKVVEIFNDIINPSNIIYVKGEEKFKFLCQITNYKYNLRIINLEKMGCDNFANLKKDVKLIDCIYKHNNNFCAINNVNLLTNWVIDFWESPCTLHENYTIKKNCTYCKLLY